VCKKARIFLITEIEFAQKIFFAKTRESSRHVQFDVLSAPMPHHTALDTTFVAANFADESGGVSGRILAQSSPANKQTSGCVSTSCLMHWRFMLLEGGLGCGQSRVTFYSQVFFLLHFPTLGFIL